MFLDERPFNPIPVHRHKKLHTEISSLTRIIHEKPAPTGSRITFHENHGRPTLVKSCQISRIFEIKKHNENQHRIDSTPPEFGQEFDFPVNSALNLAKIAFRGRLMVHKKDHKTEGLR